MGLRKVLFAALALGILAIPVIWAQSSGSAKKTAPKKKVSPKRTTARRPAATAKRTTPKVAAKKPVAKSKRRRRRARQPLPPVDPTVGDSLNGEDLIVREAAVAALGTVNGTVVVTDPNSGRVLTIVNQNLALSPGDQPCSTVKLPVALAALSEGMITRTTPIRLSRRVSMNLTEALAHSNNRYFETLGRRIGFQKWREYVSQFGFGELAGYQIPGEQLGTLPRQPAKFGGVARMSSFGFDINFTPLQLSAFVSAVANGGTLYYLQYPRTPEEADSFQPRVKRQLNVEHLLPDLREGMQAAVDYGTGKRAWQPFNTVFGKTGTCSHEGQHLGWFASYEGSPEGRLAVVVLLRASRDVTGPDAAEVAGRVYRGLYERNYRAFRPSPVVAAGAGQQ
jgi:cell division protein FtsI/penicillin-binding protein 2